MAGLIKKRLKDVLRRSLPVKAATQPRSHQKRSATNEILITGDVNVHGNILIDNKKTIKIQDSTLKRLLDKIKPIAD